MNPSQHNYLLWRSDTLLLLTHFLARGILLSCKFATCSVWLVLTKKGGLSQAGPKMNQCSDVGTMLVCVRACMCVSVRVLACVCMCV